MPCAAPMLPANWKLRYEFHNPPRDFVEQYGYSATDQKYRDISDKAIWHKNTLSNPAKIQNNANSDYVKNCIPALPFHLTLMTKRLILRRYSMGLFSINALHLIRIRFVRIKNKSTTSSGACSSIIQGLTATTSESSKSRTCS